MVDKQGKQLEEPRRCMKRKALRRKEMGQKRSVASKNRDTYAFVPWAARAHVCRATGLYVSRALFILSHEGLRMTQEHALWWMLVR